MSVSVIKESPFQPLTPISQFLIVFQHSSPIKNDKELQLISYKRYLKFTLVQWRLYIYPWGRGTGSCEDLFHEIPGMLPAVYPCIFWAFTTLYVYINMVMQQRNNNKSEVNSTFLTLVLWMSSSSGPPLASRPIDMFPLALHLSAQTYMYIKVEFH